jgi:hypothetical protein
MSSILTPWPTFPFHVKASLLNARYVFPIFCKSCVLTRAYKDLRYGTCLYSNVVVPVDEFLCRGVISVQSHNAAHVFKSRSTPAFESYWSGIALQTHVPVFDLYFPVSAMARPNLQYAWAARIDQHALEGRVVRLLNEREDIGPQALLDLTELPENPRALHAT